MNEKDGQKSPQRRMMARFDGHVQGVGFRYTALSIAEGLSVRGFVRNEADGSVTVVAEGSEDVLLALRDQVKSSQLGKYIFRDSVSWSAPTGEFRDFSVRYDE